MTEFPTELDVKIGNPVSGADFWPRPDVVDDLVGDLAQGRGSRRLFALRRIGKTSVLLEVEQRLREQGQLTVIRIDAQGLGRLGDFLSQVFDQVPIEGRLGTARKRIAANPAIRKLLFGIWRRMTGEKEDQAPADVHNEFELHGAWSGDIAAAMEEAGPVVLIIDELPYMLRNMLESGYKTADVEQFLSMLRGWRVENGVRMLLSSSIGFAQLRRTHKIRVAERINDVHPIKLPPLPRPQAVEMVEALARGAKAEGWSQVLSEAVVDASAETWPIFLQLGFIEVLRSGVRDPSQVKATVETRVRQALDESFYEQFSTRLARYEGDERAARILLRTVVGGGLEPVSFEALDAALEGINAVERRDELMEALREDDFILFDTEAQTVIPASRLVPIWVRARAWGR